MSIKTVNMSDFKKVVIGTVAAIGVCSLAFSGLTATAKAAVVNKTESIPTTYSASDSTVKGSNLPLGYVKADYEVKLSEYSVKPTTKDISAEAAAELGIQDIWKIFGVDMSNKTIEMCYHEVTSTQPRADWLGTVSIDKNLNYWFTVDAITGEYVTTGQNKYWSENINLGMNKTLLKNSEPYTSLAKKVAEKYHLVSGKIISAEYDGQGYTTNNDGSAKNTNITIMVTSENGQQAQLAFSTYNQEFLQVAYDGCVKAMKVFEQQMEKKNAEAASKEISINQDDNGVFLMETNEE